MNGRERSERRPPFYLVASLVTDTMAATLDTDYERESRELVEEFLSRDLVDPEAAERVRRLRDQGRTSEALEVILEERRTSSDDPGTLATRPRRR